MPKPKKAYQIVLPEGREVIIAELGVSEFQMSMEIVGNIESEDARSFAEGVEGLRLAVREIDGAKVTRDELQGKLWEDFFSMKETMLLCQAFSEIHAPAKGAKAGIKPATA